MSKMRENGFTSSSEELSNRLRIFSPSVIEAKPMKYGFTLIEVLVVLTIIALLVALVIVTLNGSRYKANDSKVKAQLSEVRKSAEVYFYNNSGSYTAASMAAPASACTGTFFTDVSSGMYELTGKAASWPSGTTLSCQSTDTTYAVTGSFHAANAALVPLVFNYWCVDSVGHSHAVSDHIASGVTVCP